MGDFFFKKAIRISRHELLSSTHALKWHLGMVVTPQLVAQQLIVSHCRKDFSKCGDALQCR